MYDLAFFSKQLDLNLAVSPKYLMSSLYIYMYHLVIFYRQLALNLRTSLEICALGYIQLMQASRRRSLL